MGDGVKVMQGVRDRGGQGRHESRRAGNREGEEDEEKGGEGAWRAGMFR